jgi:hypothetical protein
VRPVEFGGFVLVTLSSFWPKRGKAAPYLA